jgi:hypothetical protein
MSELGVQESGPEKAPAPDPDNPANFPPEPGDERGPGDGGATHTLFRLLRSHPFWDLYLRTSDRAVLPFRGKVAFILDVLLRAIVALAIIGVALGVAWKTLSPFPHF